ncbi:hypothetical protein BJF78_25060 [Pseudonocardia sp. CNS-139]|nr:hypothetical protein BJF78_25060 [Pseudonocardia sp. CNS-139]
MAGRSGSRAARWALLAGLGAVVFLVIVLVPMWLTAGDLTRVPAAAALGDTAEIAALERAGYTLEEQNGHDPDGGHFTEYSYASWSLPEQVESVSVSFRLDRGPAGNRRESFRSGSGNVAGDLAALRRDADAKGHPTATTSGIGDEGFERVSVPQVAHDPSREVMQAVRVQNVAILVTYLDQDGGDVEAMRRTVRGLASAAVERLRAADT